MHLRLRHLHLPHRAPALYPPYSLASRVQEDLRRRQLDSKDAAASPNADASPPPTLLSFSPLPPFTLGRRQTAPLTDDEAARLRAPLRVAPATTLQAAIVSSPRGGLTTYHGPGQVVLWPVLDLRSPRHRQFTVRCYSRLLEDTTIATLRALFGLAAFTTEDPGVWVQPRGSSSSSSSSRSRSSSSRSSPAKIAALGVHLRRHVSALGTAVNIATPASGDTDEATSPWARFVPCGLEGKMVTSAAAEVVGGLPAVDRMLGGRCREEAVATTWAEELARRIGVGAVETVSPGNVATLVAEVISQSGDVTPGEEEYLAWLQEVVFSRPAQ